MPRPTKLTEIWVVAGQGLTRLLSLSDGIRDSRRARHSGGQSSSSPRPRKLWSTNNQIDGCARVVEGGHEGRAHYSVAQVRDPAFSQRPYHGPVFLPVRPAGFT